VVLWTRLSYRWVGAGKEKTTQAVKTTPHINRVVQNRIYTPYMTVYLVISLPKIPYIHRIYMVLANLHINEGKGAVLVPGTANSLHHKNKKSIHGD